VATVAAGATTLVAAIPPTRSAPEPPRARAVPRARTVPWTRRAWSTWSTRAMPKSPTTTRDRRHERPRSRGDRARGVWPDRCDTCATEILEVAARDVQPTDGCRVAVPCIMRQTRDGIRENLHDRGGFRVLKEVGCPASFGTRGIPTAIRRKGVLTVAAAVLEDTGGAPRFHAARAPGRTERGTVGVCGVARCGEVILRQRLGLRRDLAIKSYRGGPAIPGAAPSLPGSPGNMLLTRKTTTPLAALHHSSPGHRSTGFSSWSRAPGDTLPLAPRALHATTATRRRRGEAQDLRCLPRALEQRDLVSTRHAP